MTVLAVIPARWASTRFPGKPVTLIAGRPMIAHVWDRATEAAAVDEVVIATDDERIAEVCEANRMAYEMTSGEHPTGTDRLAEVARNRPADVYVNVQGDEPLIHPDSIDAVARCLLDAIPRGIDVATGYIDGASREQQADPSVVHLLPSMDGCAISFSRYPIPYAMGEAMTPAVHVGLYAFTPDSLARYAGYERGPVERAENIEILRFLERGERIAAVPVAPGSIGVDTPEDVARVEALMKAGEGAE